MRAIQNSLIVFLFYACSVLFAQNEDVLTRSTDNYSSKVPRIEDYLFNQVESDYKIISSNSSYLEFEYYPKIFKREIWYNGEGFSIYDFGSASANSFDKSGSPDIRSRRFAIFTPSELNNTVQVLDYDVKEEYSVNLSPIPQANFRNPYSRSFEDLYYTYNKNSEYSKNKFIPENIASFIDAGALRELSLGNIVLYPYQYNPVTRTLKVYSRLRVRINFGEAPVLLNRPRTREEVSLLRGLALNSDIALNWMSPKFRSVLKDNIRGGGSALSSGDWYKIEIKDDGGNSTSEGIYKLTKSFLQGAGINFSGVDPRKIKMFGNGGDFLPEGLNDPRPDDLVELAIYIEGENDGSFDEQDYVLFYAKAINNWRYDTSTNQYNHYVNYYTRSNYYWICINTPNNGKRMQLVPSENVGSPIIPSSFLERIFYEPEQTNLINEGNLWLSFRKSSGQSFEWNTTLTGLEAGSQILYKIKPASRCLSPNTNNMLIREDYSTMSELYYQMQNAEGGFGCWIWTDTNPYSFTINQSQKTNGEQSKFRATYQASSSEAEGYLDWMEIQYKRRLNSAQGDVLRFESPNVSGTVEYNVSSFSNNNIKVFNVTEHNELKRIQPLIVTSSNVRFQKTETSGNLSKYFVVGQNGFKTPTAITSRIPNQNLRGITGGADFIIVTHKDFITAAERLKNKRESGGQGNPNYLKTMIITTEQIYNEFSGGVLDAVAIRDFLKHAFFNWNIRPSYVCFFGDGSFDYKDILGYNKNFVPAYEYSSPCIHQVEGFTSDDYFANVTGNNFPQNSPPDIAHGRIPAASIQEANEYLDKIDAYESGVNNGYWKNRMFFVADDQRTSEGCEFIQHLQQAELLAELHTPAYIDKVKAYIVTYPTVITPQGRRKPQVNSDIAKYWTEGVLNIHYTGHGSPDIWAHEYILEKDNIVSQINNVNKYPFVTIASCDMSKFDNPANKSAGELFMLAPRKGAIGTVAATRPVYAESNATFFYNLFDWLYIPRDTLLLQKRFGAAMFQTKQSLFQVNDLKYVLLCDPTIRTQMPRYRSHIDSISGLSGDTMRALSRIKIYGSILRPDSSIWNDYNGKIVLKIYDVDRQIVLADPECPPTVHNFRQNGGIIYSGTQIINNGKWVVEYIVPKDISYLNQNGRFINYFFNNQADGAGIYRNFIVGGIDPDAPIDTTGPQISLYLNNRNFRTGDIVNENFKFIADLFDESGINTTGTIGHKLEAVLDENENNKYDLSNFYTSDTSYRSGTIEYDFSSISIGRHTLRFKAWDTYNNSSESTLEFNVSTSGVLQVTNVYNYPNPFKDNTAFTFQHNYPTDINVKIKIYTVAGRLIKEIQQNSISDKFVVINWTGKDEDGETLGNGIYIYKLIVETSEGSSITSTGKLAVLK
ncbi:MAG: type IX secretion system sortase PorU [Chlorobi bacterium]|nr:type IX secretion system sortase PorU [Chlorobiota bacterium]MCI0716691.1 type IX secretion system sortase PorU [Chlorobiota bacterium]